ncbi:hypothetical protein [Tsuneonella amylolytica]|uniref:hypothetical protein n=1 Tax=Tsuneonella amylolytica TaxID=2338327 RepID=UPI001F45C4C2|nr:hypothetical protein [Tsuneonella amylolytica]
MLRSTTAIAAALAAASLANPVSAQDHSGHAMPAPAPAPTSTPPTAPVDHTRMDHGAMDHGAMDHSQMDHSQMDHGAMGHAGMDHAAMGHEMAHSGEGSGTARLPVNESMNHGAMVSLGGDTTLMLHGFVWPVYTDQTGPRGDDKFYVQSMGMATLNGEFAGGRWMARTMMSLEPAMRHDGYPNLFATGEVAYGEPLVDRQHPHDLFMELAGRVDFDIADGTTAFLYGGPVGEPALGPSSFMHRASARYNSEAPITHHWFDSTHITYGVVTAGVAARRFQLEGSAFRGREPDEFRWNIETPKLDSWSVRASFAPSDALMFQASYGFLKSPEELHADENEKRTTASVHYNNGRGLSATGAFSAKKLVEADGSGSEPVLTAWLGEVNYDITDHHTVFGRIENVRNAELFPDHSDPLHDRSFRVTKFQAGYAYRLPLGPVNLALGGTVSAFAKPDMLDSYYGKNPMGYTVFARFSLGD